MLKLYWENEQDKFEISDAHVDIIKNCIEAALSAENISYDCEVSLTITDNKNIAEINKEMRNISAPTDVLSFPMLEGKDGVINPGSEDFSDGFLLLGDIVISFERARVKQIESRQDYHNSQNNKIRHMKPYLTHISSLYRCAKTSRDCGSRKFISYVY